MSFDLHWKDCSEDRCRCRTFVASQNDDSSCLCGHLKCFHESIPVAFSKDAFHLPPQEASKVAAALVASAAPPIPATPPTTALASLSPPASTHSASGASSVTSKAITNQISKVFENEVNKTLDDCFHRALPQCQIHDFRNREITEAGTNFVEIDSIACLSHDTLKEGETINECCRSSEQLETDGFGSEFKTTQELPRCEKEKPSEQQRRQIYNWGVLLR